MIENLVKFYNSYFVEYWLIKVEMLWKQLEEIDTFGKKLQENPHLKDIA